MHEKTLITGGAGFIGSHLSERLKAAGRSLILVDDLSTGRLENVQPLLDERCTLIQARASEALQDRTLLKGVTQVYHLAAAVGVKLVVDNPTAMVRNNIDETATVLEAAAEHGASVLIASSSEVYGKCPTLPLREDMELVYGPTTASRWSYGLTKALDEHLALDYHARRGVPVVITRLFNTIGPRQVGHYGMVVPRFVWSAVRNEPIEVYGDGQQTRAFCDVRDVVRAMHLLLDNHACSGQVFNLGGDRQITISTLADLVIELGESQSEKRLIPYDQAYGAGFEDPPQRVPALERIRQAIGFAPAYELEQTLTELVDLARQQQRSEEASTLTREAR